MAPEFLLTPFLPPTSHRCATCVGLAALCRLLADLRAAGVGSDEAERGQSKIILFGCGEGLSFRGAAGLGLVVAGLGAGGGAAAQVIPLVLTQRVLRVGEL